MNPPAIPFAIAFATSFIVCLVCLRAPAASRFTRHRLETMEGSLRSIRFKVSRGELEKAEPWGYFARFESFLERFAFSARLKRFLLHADARIGVGGILTTSAAAGLLCGLTLMFVSQSIALSTVAAMAGCTAPFVVMRFKLGRRLKKFNKALPDAIDLMSRALNAGHSMASSIEIVADRSPEPLGFEFLQVFQQQRLGLQFRDALLQLGERVPSKDLHFLITAILVQKETGGDLSEILGRTSHLIRERMRIEGEVNTRTAQGRLTGWILALLPVIMLLLINLISPGYSGILFHDPLGRELMFTGAGLIVIGALIIRKIVDVQV